MSRHFVPDEILGTQDLPYQDVEVPEWGGKMVRVIGLSADEASNFASRMVKTDEDGKVKSVQMNNFMAELLVRTLANEKNELLFNPKDAVALGKKSARVITRLFRVAMDLSGLDEMSEQLAAKNSAGTPEGDLPSV